MMPTFILIGFAVWLLCLGFHWWVNRPRMQRIRLPSGATFTWPEGWTGEAHLYDGPVPGTNTINIGSPEFVRQVEAMRARQLAELRQNVKPPE